MSNREIKARITELEEFIQQSPDSDPRDAYEINHWRKEIEELQQKLIPSTKQELLDIGFKELPHYTVMDSIIYDLGRGRQISIGSVGTPNEMVFIGQIDDVNEKVITDLVVLRNYDFDGYTKVKDIKQIIEVITGKLI